MLAIKQNSILSQIDFMPIELKTLLIEKLLKSLTPIKENINDLWIKKCNQRLKDIENGKIKLVDGDKVFDKIRTRLKCVKLAYCGELEK